jgi:hypothetical protein
LFSNYYFWYSKDRVVRNELVEKKGELDEKDN